MIEFPTWTWLDQLMSEKHWVVLCFYGGITIGARVPGRFIIENKANCQYYISTGGCLTNYSTLLKTARCYDLDTGIW